MATRRMMSRRQPSLPGFPDIPEELEIKIPNMPWEQIGGDMDPGAHGGTIATADGDHIELLKIMPVRAYVGDGEAADVGFPFWTKEAWFDLSDLDPKNDDVKSALDYIGMSLDELGEDPGGQKAAGERGYTPEQRALVIAEALLDYGHGDEGTAGWSKDLPDHEVKWWGDKVATIPEYLSDEDDSFKDDVLGYSDIRDNLEKMVEQMADQHAAAAHSTVGDQDADRAGSDGFDEDSLVGVAEFGDAVGVNGDIETEKTLAGVEADLEKEGYEMTDLGGDIPSTEEFVSPEHAIQAVAKEMDLEEDVVEDAAQGIEWWPTRLSRNEIASETSGSASIWGKKDKNKSTEDPDYIVQGAYSDGRISDTFGYDDEEVAVREAKKLLHDPTFEGDNVRVITRDGELVWDSTENNEDLNEPRRTMGRSPRRR